MFINIINNFLLSTKDQILLTIVIVSLLIILLLVLLLIVFPYVCYRLTFYSKNKQAKSNEIVLPNLDVFNIYKDIIIKDIKDIRKYPYEELMIYSFDGLKLYAKYYEYEKGAPIEIMFHGYRGSAERDLSTGVKRAFRCKRNCVLIDQRGSGKSEGHVISFGINERIDCLYWTRYISKKFGQDSKIIITGISMGAATVLMASDLDLPSNVVGILADCPYDSPKAIIKKVVKEMKLPAKLVYPFIKLGARIYGSFKLEDASAIESVKKTKLPIIYFHGTSDSFVPCYMSENLYNETTSRKKLVKIEGALHGVSYTKDENTYINELNKFYINEEL